MSVFPILEAAFLGPNVKQFEIAAPRIARKQKPGQFVIVRVHENGERIPLTIKASDPQRGTIELKLQQPKDLEIVYHPARNEGVHKDLLDLMYD